MKKLVITHGRKSSALEWNKAKSELEALDERIAREEELRRQDQAYIESNEEEQRQNLDPENNPQQDEKRAQVLISGCVTVPVS